MAVAFVAAQFQNIVGNNNFIIVRNDLNHLLNVQQPAYQIAVAVANEWDAFSQQTKNILNQAIPGGPNNVKMVLAVYLQREISAISAAPVFSVEAILNKGLIMPPAQVCYVNYSILLVLICNRCLCRFRQCKSILHNYRTRRLSIQ